MTESQRQHAPTDDAGELHTAVAFLRFARECVIKKLDGLTEEQARLSLVPTETTLMGLINHLTDSERYWFGVQLAGVGDEPDWATTMAVAADDTVAAAVARYRAAAVESDRQIAQAGSPEVAAVAGHWDGTPMTLRWILAHMTSETARHAGHADILREQIDGATGR